MFKNFLLICFIAFAWLNMCKTEGDAESDDFLDSCEFTCYMYQQCVSWVSGSGGDPTKSCSKPAECSCNSLFIR